MWYSYALRAGLLVLALAATPIDRSVPPVKRDIASTRYLRVSIAHWNINLYSAEADRIFQQIQTEGIAVFRAQPGFVRYRLMRADSTTTIAVAEWESEQVGQAGAAQYRDWMRRVGIMAHFTLDTHAGDIVAGS